MYFRLVRVFSLVAALTLPVVPGYGQEPAPATPPAGPAVAPDKVVISVGGETITAAEFDQFIETLPPQYQNMARGPGRRQVADQLVNIKTLAQEARRRKLDQTDKFKRQSALATENLLAGVLYQDLATSMTVDDAAAMKYYNDHIREYEQLHARHILVRFKGSPVPSREGQKETTDNEALAKVKVLRERLDKGEDFATLAKTESDDTTTGANGGDLGTFRPGDMVPEFDAALAKMKPKELSQPIKTQFGYHLILLEERKSKDFAEVKGEVMSKARPALARERLTELRKSAEVKLDDAYFGAPLEEMPTPAPAPAK